jgi:hypothetical protein
MAVVILVEMFFFLKIVIFHLFIVPRWVTQSAPVSGHSGSLWKKDYEASYEILVAAGIKELVVICGQHPPPSLAPH